MGPPPRKEHSFHRTPATASYGPNSCIWADKRTQALEQRGKLVVDYNGTLLSRKEFERLAIADGFLSAINGNENGSLEERLEDLGESEVQDLALPRSSPALA